MAARRFKCLYSVHKHQKRKVYKDGFVVLGPGEALALLSEEGRELERADLKPGQAAQLDPDDGEVHDCLERFIFYLDGVDENIGPIEPPVDDAPLRAGKKAEPSQGSAASMFQCQQFPRGAGTGFFRREPLRPSSQAQQPRAATAALALVAAPRPAGGEAARQEPQQAQQAQQQVRQAQGRSDEEILACLRSELPMGAASRQNVADEMATGQRPRADGVPQVPKVPRPPDATAAANEAWSSSSRAAPRHDDEEAGSGGSGEGRGGLTVAKAFRPPARTALPDLLAQGAAASAGPGSAGAGASGFEIRLTFPPEGADKKSARVVEIPDSFSNEAEYKARFSRAIEEELHLKLADLSRGYHRLLAAEPAAPTSGRGGRGRGGGGGRGAGNRTSRMRAAGVMFYEGCTLACSSYPNRDEDGKLCGTTTKYHLHVGGTRERSTAYSKGDMWILSPTLAFSDPARGATGDRFKMWSLVVRSLWHGPNVDGKMEVELLGRAPPAGALKKADREIYAIRGFNGSGEMDNLHNLNAIDDGRCPLLPLLLRPAGESPPPAEPCPPSGDELLNEHQACVMARCVRWVGELTGRGRTGRAAEDPIVLCHGPFGSGKSHMLVAIAATLARALDAAGDKETRILISACTNVAVDRVLMGLADSGFEDFVRVGSLRRIAKPVLRFSVHERSSTAKSAAVAELDQMLKECSSPGEKALVQAELEAAKRGRLAERSKRLGTARVVGATCCAAGGASLQGARFKIVLLDECSQMVEPLSLVPLSHGCERLLAVGDPKQLPPVLTSPAELTVGGGGVEGGTGPHGLARAMFVRLAALGHMPLMLRTQYRLHPDLCKLPNELFYGGLLLDGCSAATRAALVPGLPPLSVLDVGPGNLASYNGASRSASSAAEARAVCAVVAGLAAHGVRGGRCGVICTFRAQVALVQRMLGDARGRAEGAGPGDEPAGEEPPEVSTVDAFQGAEKDVVIVSTCCVAGGGFGLDAQRMNVALTRGRHHLIVVGTASALQASPQWRRVLACARQSPGSWCPPGVTPAALNSTRRPEGEGGDDEAEEAWMAMGGGAGARADAGGSANDEDKWDALEDAASAEARAGAGAGAGGLSWPGQGAPARGSGDDHMVPRAGAGAKAALGCVDDLLAEMTSWQGAPARGSGDGHMVPRAGAGARGGGGISWPGQGAAAQGSGDDHMVYFYGAGDGDDSQDSLGAPAPQGGGGVLPGAGAPYEEAPDADVPLLQRIAARRGSSVSGGSSHPPPGAGGGGEVVEMARGLPPGGSVSAWDGVSGHEGCMSKRPAEHEAEAASGKRSKKVPYWKQKIQQQRDAAGAAEAAEAAGGHPGSPPPTRRRTPERAERSLRQPLFEDIGGDTSGSDGDLSDDAHLLMDLP